MSSVNYMILSFLPLKQIVRCQGISKRFYNTYVPVTLSNVTPAGAIPIKPPNSVFFAIQVEDSPNLATLRLPQGAPAGREVKRKQFWRELGWSTNEEFHFMYEKRNKRGQRVRKTPLFEFNKFSWS